MYFRFATYFSRIGKADVDVEVRRLMLSYLNGIQVNFKMVKEREILWRMDASLFCSLRCSN